MYNLFISLDCNPINCISLRTLSGNVSFEGKTKKT